MSNFSTIDLLDMIMVKHKNPGKFITEALSQKNQLLQTRAYQLLKGDEKSGIYVRICKKVQADMQWNGIKDSGERQWPQDIMNETASALWRSIHSGKFVYRHEKAFWQYVNRIWYQVWLKILRQQYGFQEGELTVQCFSSDKINDFVDQHKFDAPSEWDIHKLFKNCFSQLSYRYQVIYRAYSLNKDWTEDKVKAYIQVHHPDISIPASGLRMIKKRSEEYLKKLIEEQIKVA